MILWKAYEKFAKTANYEECQVFNYQLLAEITYL